MEKVKLFFSYGHEDENRPIVQLIRKRLEEERNYQVFIDEKIRTGENWRERLQREITSSDSVVAFLSQYAMRREEKTQGVCRDELAIAVSVPGLTMVTILLESEKQVDIPPTVSTVQYLNMSDWKEKWGTSEFEEYFEDRFLLILDALESDTIFRFHGEIEGLRKSLSPDIRRSRCNELLSKEMIGRDWLWDSFEDYLSHRDNERFLWIHGGAGFGKSHFIAHRMHYHPKVVAGYFFEWTNQNKDSIHSFIISVAFQMATRMPDYRQALITKLSDTNHYLGEIEDMEKLFSFARENDKFFKDMKPADLFSFLITNCLQGKSIDGKRDVCAIVIDGADEAVFNNENPLAELLVSSPVEQLPSWVKLVVTSRGEDDIKSKFEKLDKREINLSCDDSKEDVYEYLIHRLKKYIDEGLVSKRTISYINERCDHTFIFAEKLCDAYEKDHTVFDDPDSLPSDINGLYLDYFDRLFKDTDYNKVSLPLAVLVADRGEISDRNFMDILGWTDAELSGFLRIMRSFVKENIEETGCTLSFCHKTFNEWLVNRDAASGYTVDEKRGKELILSYCEKCLSVSDTAAFSWGFTGSKTVHSFETMKYVYDKILQLGTRQQKERLFAHHRFMYDLQLEAYRCSHLSYADRLADDTEKRYNDLSEAQKKEALRYYVGARVLKAETALTRNEDTALDDFKKISEEFGACLSEEPSLYACVERNICFLLRKGDADAARQRLDKLIDYLNETMEGTDKKANIAQCNYHYCVILYDKKNYDEAIKKGLAALNNLESDQPLRLRVLVYNQLGSCYQQKCALSEDDEEKKKFVNLQIDYKSRSLDERRRLYGKYSRYTLLGYDYMARALLDWCRVYDEPLERLSFAYAENAVKIAEYVLGKNAVLYSRAIQTKALLLEFEGNYEDALPLASDAYEILLNFKNETEAQKRAKVILDRIQALYNEKKQTVKV